VLVRADAPVAGKVGIITGGGSGHLPLFKGYVGRGLCDGVAIGNVFSSPSSAQILETTKAVDGGAGVLYLYGNYGGDVFNFDLATDMAELEGIRTLTVLGRDDVASQPKERATDRRGVAGIFFAYKAAGAAAERGDTLDQVAAVAEDIIEHTATMGVGLSPTILPTTGKPSFELADDEMEIGIGIHGEPGRHRVPLASAKEIAEQLVQPILGDLDFGSSPTIVMLNGMGGTPLIELYLMYGEVAAILEKHGVTVARSLVGNYITSLDMAGCSVTVLRADDEIVSLWDAPVETSGLRWGR